MSNEQTNIRLTPQEKAMLKLLTDEDGLSEGRVIAALIKAEVKRRKRRKQEKSE